jgi:hypothetical protein
MSLPIVTLDICRQPLSTFSTTTEQLTHFLLEFQSFMSRFVRLRLWRMGCTCSVAEAHMFRISTIDTHRERRLVVEGTLVHPWVDELRKTWSDASDSLEERSLVIDLINVTVISREGENAIFELMKQGAKFSCCGVLTRHLLKDLAHRCHTNLKDVLNRTRSKE